MKCACGGDIVTTNKPRDGERAGCRRCQSCVSIEWLLHVIDAQQEALGRAEAKITRLYQRGADTTSALHDTKQLLGDLCTCGIANLRAFVAAAALSTDGAGKG